MWGSTEKASLEDDELSLNQQLKVSHLETWRYIQGRMTRKVMEQTKAEIHERTHSRLGEVQVIQFEAENASEKGARDRYGDKAGEAKEKR